MPIRSGSYVLAVLQIGYGVAEVLDLVEREERSAGLTAALAEGAIVDGEGHEASGSQVLRLYDQGLLPDAKAVAQGDRRPAHAGSPLRQSQKGRALNAFTQKRHLLHRDPPHAG